jgi:hypothetical protein
VESGKETTGGPSPTTNVLTLPPDTKKDNHPVVALNPSSPSTPPDYPHVLILSAAQQA